MYELSKIRIRIKMGIIDIASKVMLKVIEIIVIDCDCFELEVEVTFDCYEWWLFWVEIYVYDLYVMLL